MRSKWLAGCAVLAVAALSAQTIDEGIGIFTNTENPVQMAVVASVAIEKIDAPYVFFRAFMVSDKSAAITRQNVVLIYKGQEYRMPTYKELAKAYPGIRNDIALYNRAGKEPLAMSQFRSYSFQPNVDFFPAQGSGVLPVDQGSMSGTVGFATNLYFKNPGFKKGDELAIRVTDRKDPTVFGECGVVLK